MRRIEMLEVPVRQDEMFVPGIARNGDSRTVAVYTRHKPECRMVKILIHVGGSE
jgi:hypothetical protein